VKEYIETGKLKYVYLDDPLESIHPNAFKAAEAVNCAAEQGKFWEMHDHLFDNQSALAPAQLKSHAVTLGLDKLEFDTCLENGKYENEIRKDMALAAKAGVTGTPSFGIGFTDVEDPNKVKVVRTLRGALPFNSFKTVIDGLLSQ
jgi:protein-disulfide isomerase